MLAQIRCQNILQFQLKYQHKIISLLAYLPQINISSLGKLCVIVPSSTMVLFALDTRVGTFLTPCLVLLYFKKKYETFEVKESRTLCFCCDVCWEFTINRLVNQILTVLVTQSPSQLRYQNSFLFLFFIINPVYHGKDI